MKRPLSCRSTILASYNSYIVQAIVINLSPLLFLLFREQFGVSLSQLSLLIVINFSSQLFIDFSASRIGDRIPPRILILTAHSSAFTGLICLSVLPRVMSPFPGLLIATFLLGLGGGLIEVMVSPLVEACPTEGKSRNMSLLHSFYSWGQAGVVILSGIYFLFFDIVSSWQYLPLIWAIFPLTGAISFCFVPVYRLPTVRESGMTTGKLFSTPVFLLLLIIMICSGASEQCMNQWASLFAESGLGVSKTLGDLLGPGAFALAMGLFRVLSGVISEKIRLTVVMAICCVLCIISYLLVALPTPPIVSLIGCMLCGASVACYWPGTLSLGAASIPGGGISMFALLALAGDIGCLLGPAVAGNVSDLAGGDLRFGFRFALIFPLVMLTALFLMSRIQSSRKGAGTNR